MSFDVVSVMGYNERKIEILRCVETGWCTPENVLDICQKGKSTTISSIQMALLRYHRQGLLHRRKTGRHREYEYRISERGEERLKWLVSQE